MIGRQISTCEAVVLRVYLWRTTGNRYVGNLRVRIFALLLSRHTLFRTHSSSGVTVVVGAERRGGPPRVTSSRGMGDTRVESIKLSDEQKKGRQSFL